jgi:hypothetical protein
MAGPSIRSLHLRTFKHELITRLNKHEIEYGECYVD